MYDAFYNLFGKLITRIATIIVTAMAILALTGSTWAASNSATTDSTFERTQALDDPDNRISDEFKIPKKLKDRTAFWFDVYTQYGSNQHVIHHTLYPWIVYRVVDTEPILSRPGNRWTKHHKAVRFVKDETRNVRNILKKLSGLKSYKNLKPEENAIYTALSSIPGKRSRVFKTAAYNMRVQLGQKDFFMSGLNESKKYLPIIEGFFQEQGLPTELTRLPFVESSFNVKAESKVGASGIWQIMPSTGKQHLIVSQNIDERNSPLKASQAAAQIFKKNYRSLKQWPLAVTAYNHGAAGIKRALKLSQTTNLPDLVERYHRGSFKFASANFYTSFLAALYAEKYHHEIYDSSIHKNVAPINHQIVKLKRSTKVRQVLQKTGLSDAELLNYNLDLKSAIKNNALLPRGYRVIVPLKTSS